MTALHTACKLEKNRLWTVELELIMKYFEFKKERKDGRNQNREKKKEHKTNLTVKMSFTYLVFRRSFPSISSHFCVFY